MQSRQCGVPCEKQWFFYKGYVNILSHMNHVFSFGLFLEIGFVIVTLKIFHEEGGIKHYAITYAAKIAYISSRPDTCTTNATAAIDTTFIKDLLHVEHQQHAYIA